MIWQWIGGFLLGVLLGLAVIALVCWRERRLRELRERRGRRVEGYFR